MEEDFYGIDKERAHTRALELIPEAFFWSGIDELAPFGSDEGFTALSEFRRWKRVFPDKPILGCLQWTIESVGEMEFAEYNESLLDRKRIQAQLENSDFDEHQYIYTLDVSVIATGFGQLIDEGTIDPEIKPILRLAIDRQKLWAGFASQWKFKEEYIQRLQVLSRVLKVA
ncbi:hypothetical protein AAG747_28625 [Rapidithrix thailandica]|uniref:Uncharacterized protein n=1 Tax=Rapidithrix thailandica TaxID=413964 RepID=A0AAW9SL93_9BACT